MAAYIHPNAHDAALNYIKNGVENLYICSAEPTTFAEASSTYKLGTKAAPTITGPANGDVSGRKITISAISDGTVSANGTASWVALTDDSGSLLLAAQALNATQVVSSGNEFTLTAFDIEYPDPTT